VLLLRMICMSRNQKKREESGILYRKLLIEWF
jgi:hypothetical protein